MNRVLQLLLEGETLSTAEMAKILGLSDEEVAASLEELKKANILLGWRPVLNPAAEEGQLVRAVIEVKVTPEREGGFDRMAERIAKFEQVESCYLMSGGYDLLIFVKGKTLQEIAGFVQNRLSSIDGVTSTATHFMLGAYKEQGYYLGRDDGGESKPLVSA